jgi:hypothetical protein
MFVASSLVRLKLAAVRLISKRCWDKAPTMNTNPSRREVLIVAASVAASAALPAAAPWAAIDDELGGCCSWYYYAELVAWRRAWGDRFCED